MKNLDMFRSKVQVYCRKAGYNQSWLAHEVGVVRATLSRKLNGTCQLYTLEILAIVKALVECRAIHYKADVLELLELAELPAESISAEDWRSESFRYLKRSFSKSESEPASKNEMQVKPATEWDKLTFLTFQLQVLSNRVQELEATLSQGKGHVVSR